MSKFKPNPRSPLSTLTARKTYGSGAAAGSGAVLAAETPVPEPVEVRPERVEVAGNAMQRIGFSSLLLFLLFKFSFLHEFLDIVAGLDLHLVVVVSSMALLFAVGSGRLGEAFRDRVTWIWLGFIFFMALATLTSTWPGGSFPVLITYIRTAFPIVFVLPALTATKRELGRVFGVLGVACVVAVGLGFANSDFKTGRMSVDQQGSSGELTNSNDYAAYLIMLLPALAYLTLRPGRSRLVKVLGFGLIGVSMYEIFSTGSRGGLVALGVMLLYVALTGSSGVRAGILVGIPVLALAAIPFVPQESMLRLKTLYSSDVPTTGEAEESKEARIELLKASLHLTWEHPFTGIGPDQFMVKQALEAKQQGHRGMWHVTHNAYTQISCECGIPAFLLYLAATILTFMRFFRLRKHPDPEISMIAGTAAVTMVGFGACIFFLSMGYVIQPLVMSGIAIAATSIAGRQTGPPSSQAIPA